MCLKPVHIRIKRTTIANGSPLYVDVPCGHCYQCRQRKQGDYFTRSYFETLYTFQKGGYVLMDTLTYAPEHLPHVSDFVKDVPKEYDFPTFNSDNVRLFLAALRSRLKRDGFNIGGSLRYFLASEYGTSLTKSDT